MKSLLVAVFALGMAFNSSAQKEEKVRELGLSFSNLDDFSMVYRFGDQNSLWRISLVNANLNFQPGNNSNNESVNAGLGLRFGKEWRKPLNGKFNLRYGADLLGRVALSNTDFSGDSYNRSRSLSGGVVGVFGFNYTIGRGLIFGAEVLPGINYSASNTISKNVDLPERENSNSLINFTLDNSLELSLIYQF